MKKFLAGLKGLGFSRAVGPIIVVIPSSLQFRRSRDEESEESAFQIF